MTGKLVMACSLIIGAMVHGAQAQQQYYGNMTANRFMPPAVPQPPGTFNNPYGNSFNSPRLYDSQGNFHGDVNSNPYDPNSVANPYGRYGSPYSSDSINNPYSQYGSPYGAESPNNPYGQGMPVYGPDN